MAKVLERGQTSSQKAKALRCELEDDETAEGAHVPVNPLGAWYEGEMTFAELSEQLGIIEQEHELLRVLRRVYRMLSKEVASWSCPAFVDG